MLIREILQQATKQLEPVSQSARLDAEILLAFALQKDRGYLYAYPEEPVSESVQHQFTLSIKKRCQQVPIAYITGQQEFWSLHFAVSPAVLIPRPETEHLVEYALTHLPAEKKCRVADLGTGSGAIAIALAHERPHWEIVATEVSPSALALAKQNAAQHHINSITFVHSNGQWVDALPPFYFDAIISNPPYIAKDDPHCSADQHEPTSALFAEHNGLADIEAIIKHAKKACLPSAFVAIEHGFMQAPCVQQLFKQYEFQKINTIPDLAGHARFTVGRITSG